MTDPVNEEPGADVESVQDGGARRPRSPRAAAERAAGVAAERAAGAAEAARRRLSLSSRMRAEGFDYSDEQLKVYRSKWRVVLRRIIQRGIFRVVVKSAVTPSVDVNRRVKSIRGPFVLLANHTSHVDAPLLAMSLPWTQGKMLSTGVAADYWYPKLHRRLFVRWMMNAYFIDRDGSRRNAGVSKRLLRSGVPILVFPEGGRQKTGRLGEFKAGGAALASSTGVPVVPAAIVGGFEAMPKGRFWPKPGRPPVAVFFGEPLVAEPGESVSDFNTRIRDAVADLYQSNHDRILGTGQQGSAS